MGILELFLFQSTSGIETSLDIWNTDFLKN
jgi:hypothetical protein